MLIDLESRPSQLTPAPVMGQLETLPMPKDWGDFERLLWRILRDVEGLRDAEIYGERGQKQYGLDVVAFTSGRGAVALQAKNYKAFYPQDLRDAISKFTEDGPSFEVTRLIVAAAPVIDSTKVKQAHAELRESLKPIALELWDGRRISEMLRGRPDIVMQFFGQPTAERFCAPFMIDPIVVPGVDAVAMRDAAARSPEAVTGVDRLLDRARKHEHDEPAVAVDLIAEAQRVLVEQGYPAHAAAHERRRRGLLVRLDRRWESAQVLLNHMWEGLAYGRTQAAQSAAYELEQLKRAAPPDHAGASELAGAVRVARQAVAIALDPLGSLPQPHELHTSSDPLDHVRLLLLAGEIALANLRTTWILAAADEMEEAVTLIQREHAQLAVRLRLLLAEGRDEWTALLDEARTGKLRYDLAALVKARHARWLANRMEFELADREWAEAVGDACLAQSWSDASRWLFARRAFSSKWKPLTDSELFPMQMELIVKGPHPTIIPVDNEALSNAQGALRDQRLRSAAISAQRATRDAAVTGDWGAEQNARRTLGLILQASDEIEVAAAHLIWAGDVKAAKSLGEEQEDRFIDVSEELLSPNYWSAAAAFQLLASESDLIPDCTVNKVVRQALHVMQSAAQGILVDLLGFDTSVFRNAVRALASLATRLAPSEASEVLSWFESQDPVEPGHYRSHDDDEARTVAAVGMVHTDLTSRCLNHLIPLLSRSQTSRTYETDQTINSHFDQAKPLLRARAEGGDNWATDTLAAHERPDPNSRQAIEAFIALTTPLVHKLGVYTVGTNAIAQSLRLRGTSSEKAEQVIEQMLARTMDLRVGSSDRTTYLLAASNLSDRLAETAKRRLFPTALAVAKNLPESALDESLSAPVSERQSGPPVHFSAHALYLAACLTTTQSQREEVRDSAFALAGTDRSDYWFARVLQKVTDSLDSDVGYLAGQGWALRSLAALVWARTAEPTYVGAKLAVDQDPRVRRTLALELSQAPLRPGDIAVRDRLASDPRYSVRAAIMVTDSSDRSTH